MNTKFVFSLFVALALLASAAFSPKAVLAAENATGCEESSALNTTLDSATRSYLAQGRAILAERNKIDSATRSYLAWGQAALEAELNSLDSATRSYIAQGRAIEAQQNAIDSATRSYIAWGMAVLAEREAALYSCA